MKYVPAAFAFAPAAFAFACGAPLDDEGTASAQSNDTNQVVKGNANAAQDDDPVDVEAPTQRQPMPMDTSDDLKPVSASGSKQTEPEPDAEQPDEVNQPEPEPDAPQTHEPAALQNEPYDASKATLDDGANEVAEPSADEDDAPEQSGATNTEGTDAIETEDTGETDDPVSKETDDEIPDLSTLHTALSSEHANDPYSCIQEQIVSAALCGTDTVRDGTLCGKAIVEDAALCGTHAVTDGTLCGTSIVEDATLCGVQHVTSGALCGTSIVTDGLTCGWDAITSLFGGSSPKSSEVELSCDVPASCEVAATCEIASQCEVATECEIPRSCEFESCSQSNPGGACLPGIAECDTHGFSCQFSADQDVFRCLPDFNTDLDMADKAVCEPFYDRGLSAMAQSAGITMSYSTGTAAGAGAAGSYEVGTVYGANGEFGCFISTCVGAQLDLSIAQFASFGAFLQWDSFAGNGKSVSVGGSLPVLELGVSSASVVSSDFGDYLGQVDSISLGVGVLPVTLAYLSCNTTVYQVQ